MEEDEVYRSDWRGATRYFVIRRVDARYIQYRNAATGHLSSIAKHRRPASWKLVLGEEANSARALALRHEQKARHNASRYRDTDWIFKPRGSNK